MEKETRPAFLFYAADFSAGTKGMDAATIGMYVLLLCYQWENGSIPNDEKQLWRIACADSIEHFRDAWALLKHKFGTAQASGKKGHLQNDKLEIIRITSREKDKGRSDKAKIAAKKRWELQRERERLEKQGCLDDAQALPEYMLNECSSNAIIGDGNGNGNYSISSNSLTVLHSSIEGGMGGDKFSDDFDSHALLYRDFIQAYGDFGRQQKRGAIEQALIDAMRRLKEIQPEATWNQCSDLLIYQAKEACKSDQANGQTKRLNPETWLINRVYETNINLIKQPTKMSPTQRMDAALDKFAAKILGGQNDK